MRKVVLLVNGKKFKEVDLKAGEVRKFDIAAAMKPGYTNTITVRFRVSVRGKKGASAVIVIADIPQRAATVTASAASGAPDQARVTTERK